MQVQRTVRWHQTSCHRVRLCVCESMQPIILLCMRVSQMHPQQQGVRVRSQHPTQPRPTSPCFTHNPHAPTQRSNQLTELPQTHGASVPWTCAAHMSASPTVGNALHAFGPAHIHGVGGAVRVVCLHLCTITPSPTTPHTVHGTKRDHPQQNRQ